MEPNIVLKGSLQTIILKLLQDNGRMYGYEITKAVKELSLSKIVLTEAALYPTLHKLLEEDLLETTSEIVDGRLRKYYSLSNKGKKDVLKKIDILKSSLDAVQLLLNNKLSYG